MGPGSGASRKLLSTAAPLGASRLLPGFLLSTILRPSCTLTSPLHSLTAWLVTQSPQTLVSKSLRQETFVFGPGPNQTLFQISLVWTSALPGSCDPHLQSEAGKGHSAVTVGVPSAWATCAVAVDVYHRKQSSFPLPSHTSLKNPPAPTALRSDPKCLERPSYSSHLVAIWTQPLLTIQGPVIVKTLS